MNKVTELHPKSKSKKLNELFGIVVGAVFCACLVALMVAITAHWVAKLWP